MPKVSRGERMTHDELLARLDFLWGTENTDKALRAVIKLHTEHYSACLSCEIPDYPCPTLRTIEKELNG